MTTVYISSTFADLKEYRESACLQLRRLAGCQSVAMEDYVACDERPLAKCLEDVSRCDIYVGIFAWRYGFIPRDDNPAQLSITELEYRRATELKKECLIFLLEKSTPWQPDFCDYKTKENDCGARIDKLRAQLAEEHVVSFFTTPENLVNHVSVAVQNLLTVKSTQVSKVHLSFAHLPDTKGTTLVGRDDELALLSNAWLATLGDHEGHPRVITLAAFAGVGKTTLVAHWMAQLAAQGWKNADRVFEWSFYTQGGAEYYGASSDSFIREALVFFGDDSLAFSNATPSDKGKRLATLVSEGRNLLVLDGIEPLQYPPGLQAGEIRDPGLKALLLGIARQGGKGLCVVTTRGTVKDLKRFQNTTAHERKLDYLSDAAGAELLYNLGVKSGTQEDRQALSRDVGGHALTLELLGSFLVQAHQGDIRRRDRVKLEQANAKMYGGHAFKVMSEYELWLQKAGVLGAQKLALLRLMGLFDRRAHPGCLQELRRPPAIEGLTESLVDLSEDEWHSVVSELEQSWLVKTSECVKSSYGQQVAGGRTIDVHPLMREYFASMLRKTNPKAFRKGHNRLYLYLQKVVPGNPKKIDGLEPLYEAVAHGCLAKRHVDAYKKIYRARILRGKDEYSWHQLGALSADLGAVACFFDLPWKQVSSGLCRYDRSWLFHAAAFRLRALGRLQEAREPLKRAYEMSCEDKDWENAAKRLSDMSEVELTLGEWKSSITDAMQAVKFADRSATPYSRLSTRAWLAHAIHLVGRRKCALKLFEAAEQIQPEDRVANYPRLLSVWGHFYSDALLAEVERAAWLGRTNLSLVPTCEAVLQRTVQALDWSRNRLRLGLLTLALDQLTIARVELYLSILGTSPERRVKAAGFLNEAIQGLRASNSADHIPRGLLTRAWLSAVEGDTDGTRAALDEAFEIAELGQMPLFIADVCLYRARLLYNAGELHKARQMIERFKYRRRIGELVDAERAG